MKRAFPVVYAENVEKVADFYKILGFAEQVRMPESGEAGYIGLKRDESEISITTVDSPKQLIGVTPGNQPRFEMFIYVDDVDSLVKDSTIKVLKEPQDMPWGERIAYVQDPEGNPVALANSY